MAGGGGSSDAASSCGHHDFSSIDFNQQVVSMGWMIEALILVSILFEFGTHRLEKWLEHESREHYLPVLHSVYKELIILGMISLLLFVEQTFGGIEVFIGNIDKTTFEFVHLTLFLSMLLYLAFTVLVLVIARRTTAAWQQNEADMNDKATEVEEIRSRYLDDLKAQSQMGFLQRAIHRIRNRQNHLVDLFYLLKAVFMRQHELMEPFLFGPYISLCIQDMLSSLVEVHWSVWFFLFVLVLLNNLRKLLSPDSSLTSSVGGNTAFFLIVGYLLTLGAVVVFLKCNDILKALVQKTKGELLEQDDSKRSCFSSVCQCCVTDIDVTHDGKPSLASGASKGVGEVITRECINANQLHRMFLFPHEVPRGDGHRLMQSITRMQVRHQRSSTEGAQHAHGPHGPGGPLDEHDDLGRDDLSVTSSEDEAEVEYDGSAEIGAGLGSAAVTTETSTVSRAAPEGTVISTIAVTTTSNSSSSSSGSINSEASARAKSRWGAVRERVRKEPASLTSSQKQRRETWGFLLDTLNTEGNERVFIPDLAVRHLQYAYLEDVWTYHQDPHAMRERHEFNVDADFATCGSTWLSRNVCVWNGRAHPQERLFWFASPRTMLRIIQSIVLFTAIYLAIYINYFSAVFNQQGGTTAVVLHILCLVPIFSTVIIFPANILGLFTMVYYVGFFTHGKNLDKAIAISVRHFQGIEDDHNDNCCSVLCCTGSHRTGSHHPSSGASV